MEDISQDISSKPEFVCYQGEKRGSTSEVESGIILVVRGIVKVDRREGWDRRAKTVERCSRGEVGMLPLEDVLRRKGAGMRRSAQEHR